MDGPAPREFGGIQGRSFDRSQGTRRDCLGGVCRGIFSEAAARSPVQLGGRSAGAGKGAADVRQTFGGRSAGDPAGVSKGSRQGAGKGAAGIVLVGDRGSTGGSDSAPARGSVGQARPRGTSLGCPSGTRPLGKHRLPRGVPQFLADRPQSTICGVAAKSSNPRVGQTTRRS